MYKPFFKYYFLTWRIDNLNYEIIQLLLRASWSVSRVLLWVMTGQIPDTFCELNVKALKSQTHTIDYFALQTILTFWFHDFNSLKQILKSTYVFVFQFLYMIFFHDCNTYTRVRRSIKPALLHEYCKWWQVTLSICVRLVTYMASLQ